MLFVQQQYVLNTHSTLLAYVLAAAAIIYSNSDNQQHSNSAAM